MTASFDAYPELCIKNGPVTLRVVPAHDLVRLGEMVASGLFPDSEPTIGEWYDPDDLVSSARRAIAFHMQAFTTALPEHWQLPLGVYVDGELVGAQSLNADWFLIARVVSSGSWLAPDQRGRGYGKLARHAVLSVAFSLLDAQWAATEALDRNVASQRVTQAMGYVPDGIAIHAYWGEATMMRRYRLSRADWFAQDHALVSWSGFDSWLATVGLDSSAL